jgi:DNA-binding MarR family transcriptional regulator
MFRNSYYRAMRMYARGVLSGYHPMVKTSPGVETDLGWALGAITRSYLRAAREAVADVPGGARGYLVLAAAGQGEPKSQLALAQHLGVDRTAMTYLLDDLEGAGLVERRPDPADRRARRVTLTDAGTARLRELKGGLYHVEDRLLEPLDDDDRATLRVLLQRLATNLAPANPCEASPCEIARELEESTPIPRTRRVPAGRAAV